MVVNRIEMPAQPNLTMRRMFFRKMASESPTDHNANGNEPIQTIIKNPRTTVTTTSTNSQSSTTTTRVSKSSTSSTSTSQRRHVTSDLKASNMKSDLVELKNNLNDMKNSLPNTLIKFKSSLENLVDADDEMSPIVTFPDDNTPVPSEIGSPTNVVDTLKFEQKTTNNFKKTMVTKDGMSAEKESAKVAESKKIQAGDVSYEENSAAAAIRARLEIDGVSAEKSLLTAKEARSLKAGELSQQESKNMAQSNMKLTTDKFSSERTAIESQQQRQTVTTSGIYNQEKHSSSSSHIYTSTKGSSATAAMMQAARFHLKNGTPEEAILNTSLDDLDGLSAQSDVQDIEKAKHKYSTYLSESIQCLQKLDQSKDAPLILNKMNDVMCKAWAVPTYGHELGYELCNALRNSGGLDLIMQNCTKSDRHLQFSSAKLLEQCLTAENRAYVVEHGLDKVINVACVCTKNSNSVDHSRVGTGILEHLFKHSEETCSDVVGLGGLDALLFECRKTDIETLRHCAGALANLSLYGGAENQEAMIKRQVPMWLFPLAFHNDDNIKYYACLAITVLVANPEIEAQVLQSGTLDLVEPFVTSHNPSEFAKSNLAHAHGQSKTWLKNLVPVLSSKREEARNLAAFHFCMEAGIKKQQGNTNSFPNSG
ncbi:hypothetical protein JTB14_005138 [Gonioctena quinquepunctata]|nr:hypothetical protein JTB14_005138 [Gonioctena quinquepunctata]